MKISKKKVPQLLDLEYKATLSGAELVLLYLLLPGGVSDSVDDILTVIEETLEPSGVDFGFLSLEDLSEANTKYQRENLGRVLKEIQEKLA